MNRDGEKLIVAANFSEGKDPDKIDTIAQKIEMIPEIVLLDVEPNPRFNRTNITYGGPPQKLLLATKEAAHVAALQIDMRQHSGMLPRIGAMDSVAFIPVNSRQLNAATRASLRCGEVLARELNIPIYLFGFAAKRGERREISSFREFQYEDLSRILKQPEWKPDFGPARFHAQFGACLVGSRFYYITLIIYLDSEEINLIEDFARIYTTVTTLETDRDLSRTRIQIKTSRKVVEQMKKVQTFIDFIPTEKIIRLICKIKNYKEIPLHLVYEFFKAETENLGIPLMGSQLVGYTPAEALIDTGKFYFEGREKTSFDDPKYIRLAVNCLRLNAMEAFDPERQILDFHLIDK